MEDLTAKTENLKIEARFEKWNQLPPEVQLEYIKAIGSMKTNIPSENIVKLNIGGTVFQTSKSTLTMHKGFFQIMLETELPLARDDAGCIFIDRDPTHFRSILNFMRDGHVELPEAWKELKEIQNEAQYYLLDGLVKLCNGELEKRDRNRRKTLHNNKNGKLCSETNLVDFRFQTNNPNKHIVAYWSDSLFIVVVDARMERDPIDSSVYILDGYRFHLFSSFFL